MELEPRRYDRILNEAPDDVLGAIFGFLLFESSTAAKDDDGVRAPLPPLLPQSAAAAALGLPEHADLAKLRESVAVASRLAVVAQRWRNTTRRAGAYASLVLRHDKLCEAFDSGNDAALISLTADCRRVWFRDDGSGAFRKGVEFEKWLWGKVLPLASYLALRCCGCPALGQLGLRTLVVLSTTIASRFRASMTYSSREV